MTSFKPANVDSTYEGRDFFRGIFRVTHYSAIGGPVRRHATDAARTARINCVHDFSG
jgi:hypothetical protein